MMEEKINELEKLKRVNRRRKIVIIILLIIFLIEAIILFGSIVVHSIEESNNARERMKESWRQGIEQLNSRFMPYIGNAILGKNVRELCNEIRMTNQGIKDERMAIYVKFGDITGIDTREKWKNSDATCDKDEISSLMSKIYGIRRYDITASYDENGRIMGIGIIERPSGDNTNIQSTNNINNI